MTQDAQSNNYPTLSEELFEFAAGLTRLQPQAKKAAYLVLVKRMSVEAAGLEAGYTGERSATSAASRAALRIAKAANACPCCGRPFDTSVKPVTKKTTTTKKANK